MQIESKKKEKKVSQYVKVGLGEVSITPPIGESIPGYFEDRKSIGIHDELYAKTIILDDGKTKVVIISCDIIGIEQETILETKKLTNKELGVLENNIVIHSTHTHTGAPTVSAFEVNKNEDYLEILPKLLLGSVIEANNNLKQAKIGFGSGKEEDISFNRRYLMKDGAVRTNPGYGNKNIVKPAGPIDSEVGVIKIEDNTGKLMGILVNFACHLDTVGSDLISAEHPGLSSNNLISADFPGVISKIIKKIKGEDLIVSFATGACGNINHCDFIGGKLKRGYFKHTNWMGTILAGEVIKVLEKIETGSKSILRIATKKLNIPVRIPSSQDLKFARRLVQVGIEGLSEEEKKELKSRSNLFGNEIAWEKELIYLSKEKKEAQKVEITVVRIGDSALVFLPGEIFVEFGLKIKKNSKFKPTLIIELSNSGLGYIPTKEAFMQNTGYEERLSRSSRLIPEAGDLITETAINLLKEVEA